jgi:hypothetical protein
LAGVKKLINYSQIKFGGIMKAKYFLLVFFLIFTFVLQEVPAQEFQTGEIAVVMSNFGRVRVIDDSLSGVRQIDRSSFLAGINPNYVFSYLLSSEPEDSMKNVLNPQLSDYEIYGSINNSYDTTGQSPDFLVKHNVYGWDGGAYILVKFTVLNRESVDHNTVLGMEIIPQTDGSYGLESVEFLQTPEIISMYRLPTSVYTGYKILSHTLTSLRSFEWYSGYNTSNPDLYSWLTYGQIDMLYEAGGDGAVSIFAKDAVNIPASEEVEMWVGISVGDNESEMVANMGLAKDKYDLITVGVEREYSTIPSDYVLNQNYPNPFNPSTTIRFAIQQSELVSLKIFDVLGNEVANLVNEELTAGSYKVQFDATSLTSGIYFYQIITSNYSETKKMNLIK